jgi:hypothetical protein
VTNGFVVFCIPQGKWDWVAFHYDLARRQCKGYRFPVEEATPSQWYYSVPHHTIVLLDGKHGSALDLTLGVRYPPAGDFTGRAAEAWAAAAREELPRRRLKLVATNGMASPLLAQLRSCLAYHPATGRLQLIPEAQGQPWSLFLPLSDGQALYKQVEIQEAQHATNVLAIKCLRGGRWRLHLFTGPEGRLLCEHTVNLPQFGFALSSDGRLVAVQTQGNKVQVYGVGDTGMPLIETRAGGYSQTVNFRLEPSRLIIVSGKKHGHIVDWSGAQLVCQHVLHYQFPNQQLRTIPVNSLLYDKERFTSAYQGRLLAAVDSYGHVLLFDQEQKLLCICFRVRGAIAGWMPDGTRFGPRSLLGGPATPGWERKFAQVLREASQRGGS